jgi:hypothetical protein
MNEGRKVGAERWETNFSDPIFLPQLQQTNMEATAILAIVDGALTILEQVAPLIQQAVQRRTITPEQQQAVYDRVQALRPGGTAFQGPEWALKP